LVITARATIHAAKADINTFITKMLIIKIETKRA